MVVPVSLVLTQWSWGHEGLQRRGGELKVPSGRRGWAILARCFRENAAREEKETAQV